MNLLKFGIAGYGKMGRIREQTLSDSKYASLISIFEINDYECKNKNIYKSNSFEELINLDIDAIIISSYVSVASEYVIRALNSGKHVFCEKPPSMNSKEMLEVIRAEKNSGKILKYGFNHRFHYSVMEAKKLIDDNSLGKLLWMRGVYGKAGSIDFHENWRNYKNYSGGGILLDQGIHMLDLFRYFTNEEFECLSSHLTSSFWDVECEDNAFLTLQSHSNIVATLHSSATQWNHKFLLEMTFENGYINLNGILSPSRSYTPETMTTGMREFEDITFAMGKPKETTTSYEYDESWNYELKEFIDAINKVAKVKNGTSNDALEIMKLIDSIYQN
jgi:predicted dehydrogenase